jgi:hypothetical protein
MSEGPVSSVPAVPLYVQRSNACLRINTISSTRARPIYKKHNVKKLHRMFRAALATPMFASYEAHDFAVCRIRGYSRATRRMFRRPERRKRSTVDVAG